MPLYQLSNAQRKELLVRATPVFLALPAPPRDPRDPIDWARSVLPSDVRHLVHTADQESVEVAPKPTGPRNTLTDVLGAIVGPKPPASLYTVWIDCIVVCLLPPGDEARHKGGPVQWPVNVIIDGKPLLQQKSSENQE